MSEYALVVKQLTKVYGKNRVVDQLDLHVPAGQVYGLLGKNGAGKTTTIRMIMGLVRPDAGEVFLNGRNIISHRRWASSQIGAIIETPGLYSNLTAKENLLITTRLFRSNPSRVDEVLNIVHLKDIGNKKVKEFSLGMRQRLGIANALIHSPKVLILDEPTNGLDPIGIRDMRVFIRELSQSHGITTIISSHILSEIEKTVDYVGIVDRGRLIKETDIGELSTPKQANLSVEVDDMAAAEKVLDNMRLSYRVEQNNLFVNCSREFNDQLNRTLINGGVKVFSLIPTTTSLEEQFVQFLH